MRMGSVFWMMWWRMDDEDAIGSRWMWIDDVTVGMGHFCTRCCLEQSRGGQTTTTLV